MMDISVCSIAWNESELLPMWVAQLRSIPQIKQIILVDTGSIDDTVAVARDLGIEVYEREFAGFDVARNTAIGYAKCDWLALQWDVDEFLSAGFNEYLNSLEKSPANMAFVIPRFIDIFDRDWVMYCRNSGPSTRYLVNKVAKPIYKGYFPECLEISRTTPQGLFMIGRDPIDTTTLGKQPGLIHGRSLKMNIKALKQNTSIVTQEGLSRLRYFMNRTWKWDTVEVGPSYVAKALDLFKNGDTSMVDYIGTKEMDWIMSISNLVRMPMESYLCDAVKPFLDKLPHNPLSEESIRKSTKNKVRDNYGQIPVY